MAYRLRIYPSKYSIHESLDGSRDYVVLMGGTRAARDAGLPLEQGS